MKILHTADIHLRQTGDDRWTALKRLLEAGNNEGARIIAISGDLFDKGTDADHLRPKIREVFSKTESKIVIIPGNHDMDSYKKGMYFGDDAVILTDLFTPFEYKDINIWGMPFEPVERIIILERFHSLAKCLPEDKMNILLYHGELLDTFFSRRDFGDEGEERYMPLRLSDFAGLNLDYVLAGHFHSRFDIRKLENGGYFVYPGSPVSITKKETGQRCVNIFEPGNPPKEYFMDTPHFEEVIIEFDPIEINNPMDIVKEGMSGLHSNARVILRVKGFVNCEALGMKEQEIVEKIKYFFAKRCVEEYYEFKDVHNILQDDLFKSFMKKLEEADFDDNQKRHMRDIAIRAMMG